MKFALFVLRRVLLLEWLSYACVKIAEIPSSWWRLVKADWQVQEQQRLEEQQKFEALWESYWGTYPPKEK